MICVLSGCQERDTGGNSCFYLWPAKNERVRDSVFLFYLREGRRGSTESPSTSQCLEVSRQTGERVCMYVHRVSQFGAKASWWCGSWRYSQVSAIVDET